jgi:hypothetical protein
MRRKADYSRGVLNIFCRAGMVASCKTGVPPVFSSICPETS